MRVLIARSVSQCRFVQAKSGRRVPCRPAAFTALPETQQQSNAIEAEEHVKQRESDFKKPPPPDVENLHGTCRKLACTNGSHSSEGILEASFWVLEMKRRLNWFWSLREHLGL